MVLAAPMRSFLQEAYRRFELRERVLSAAYGPQRSAIKDPSNRKVLWTTRRAGKTTTAILDFIYDGLAHPKAKYAYIALTHPSAEDIAWPILTELFEKFDLGDHFQESKLRATLPNGANIKLYGADRPGWAKRLYGPKYRRVYIDESAFYSISLYDLIEDYLEPSTLVPEKDGQIWVMSIPGHMPRGLFDDAVKCFPVDSGRISGMLCERASEYSRWKWNKKLDRPTGWSVHRWTTADNPAMAEVFSEEIEKKRARNPDIEEDPRFQRNYLGRRIQDVGEMVYKFDWDKNTFPGQWTVSPGDHIVIGLDFGFDDRNAFSVCVWRDDYDALVELESIRLEPGILLDQVYSYHRALIDAYNAPGVDVVTVGDNAHKQLFEEYRRRFNLNVIPAQKGPKFDRIAVYNSALSTAKVLVQDPAASPHVEEMTDLVWYERKDGTKVPQPGSLEDCCDAALMAFEFAKHYLFEEEDYLPPTSRQANMEEQRRMQQMELDRQHAMRRRDGRGYG